MFGRRQPLANKLYCMYVRFWNRFLDCGWFGSKAWDMVQIYKSITSSERNRIERIEMLDEGELLVQLFQHYCISIAWTDKIFQDIEMA